MMKKITFLAAFLISAMSYGQTLANHFATSLETTNTCNILDEDGNRHSITDNTVTITTNSKDVQYFNLSWIFKGTDTKNKKVPTGSTIENIIDISASDAGFSVIGLDAKDDATTQLEIGTFCANTGAKILATVSFSAFNDDANLTTSTLTVTTNPANVLGDDTKYLTETFTVIINYDTTASVDQLEKFNFSYAPNPSKDFIKVSAANNIENVEIYNLIGQKMLSKNLNSNSETLNISHLAKGVYVMNVTIDGSKGSFKIIKE